MNQKVDYNFNWSNYFKVCKDSPSGLVRFKNRVGKDIKGYSVGTKYFRGNGEAISWRLGFKYKLYQVHRIIWVITYGSIDDNLYIDHLDGDPFNNKIENLSLKTPAGNSMNKRQYKNNTTGVTGVSLRCNKSGNWYYVAIWYDISGKQKFKRFSVDKLGENTARALATAYREQQIQRLISEGADYTERHGL